MTSVLLIEANVLTVARPDKALQILDEDRSDFLPLCQRPSPYLQAMEHLVRGSAEMSRRNYLEAIEQFDAQLQLTQEANFASLIADVGRGFAIHLFGSGTYEPCLCAYSPAAPG